MSNINIHSQTITVNSYSNSNQSLISVMIPNENINISSGPSNTTIYNVTLIASINSNITIPAANNSYVGNNTSNTYTYTITYANSVIANITVPYTTLSNIVYNGNWQRLLVGSGGFVRGIHVAPDGTVVSRTDTNGAFYYNGSTWVQLFNANSLPSTLINNTDISLIGQGCFEIQIAASNTEIFYAAYLGFVWVSSNRGSTWTQTAFTQDAAGMNPNDNFGQYGQRMAIDPNNSNIVFVGTENNGLWKTINGGASWTQISTSSIPVGSSAGITGIIFNAAGTVTGGATQTIYASSYGNGVYVSNNAGSTWTLTSSGPINVEYAAIDSSGNLYVIGNAGANAFKYSGGTWSTLVAPVSGDILQAIAINPFNISEVIVIGAGGQLYISQNAGASFTTRNLNTSLSTSDIPWLLDANSFEGSPSPFFFLDSGGLAFSPITNGLLYLSAGTGMWQMNLPSGANASTALVWTDFSIGIEQLVANAILISPINGSTPLLASWDRPFFDITNLASYPSTYGPVNSDTIQAGWSVDYASSSPGTIVGLTTWGGVSQSGITTNNGGSWTQFGSTAANFAQSFGNGGGCIAASTPLNIIWAPAGGTSPSYTTNGGSTWTQISISGISSWTGYQGQYYIKQRSVTADRVTANTFYLYFQGNGVYISTNGGATWTQQKSGFIESNGSLAGFNSTLMSVPGNAGQLFYTSGPQTGFTPTSNPTQPFYRSINSGVTWTAVTNVTGVVCFNFGAIAPGKTYPSIYIVGYVSGVYGVWYSIDNAVTWTSIGNPNSTLQGLQLPACIAADPNNFGYVYIGTAGGGYVYYTP